MNVSGGLTITSFTMDNDPVADATPASSEVNVLKIDWDGPSGIAIYDVFYTINGVRPVELTNPVCNNIPKVNRTCTFTILPQMVGTTVRLVVEDADPTH